MPQPPHRLNRAYIHLDRLCHNLALLQREVGECSLWPVIKANAYGHGAEIVAGHLLRLGYRTLGVADVAEVEYLRRAGIEANWIVLSASLPEHAEALVAHRCEPVVCTLEMARALSRAASSAGTLSRVHLKVDTGMGRVGIRPEEAIPFLDGCRELPGIEVRGLMSHFPRADEADKHYSLQQVEIFRQLSEATRDYGIRVRHMANSAGILDLPGSHFDAARPGIALYGLPPSAAMRNPRTADLQPVLDWKSAICFLKEVPAGTGLSYGHAFHTRRTSLVATLPVGYGDGLSRALSNRMDLLVHGVRCPQVGRITMDMTLVDVTALNGRVCLGDEAVLIGAQDGESITADEWAAKLDTINYEVVTGIAHRVPRIAVGS